MLACLHVPTERAVSPPAGPEIYGEPGLWMSRGFPQGVGHARVPGGFALAVNATITIYGLPGGLPLRSFPTPCAAPAAPFYGTRTAISASGADVVLACGSREVFRFDPVTGASTPLGTADKAIAGASTLLLSGVHASWLDPTGVQVAAMDIPFRPGSVVGAGTLWVFEGGDPTRLWWIDLATGVTHQEQEAARTWGHLATDGQRIVKSDGAGLRWIDTASGAPMVGGDGVPAGSHPYIQDLTFVGHTLWVAASDGFHLYAAPGVETATLAARLPVLPGLSGNDEGLLVVGSGAVAAWAADGTADTPLPSPWWGVEDFGLSADGGTLAVADWADDRFVVNRRSGAIREWHVEGGEALVRPSDDGRWIAVSAGPSFLSPTGMGEGPTGDGGIPVQDGRWLQYGCFQTMYWDGRHSVTSSWCPDVSPTVVTSHAVVLPGGMGRVPFAENPAGDHLAIAYRHGYAVIPAGPHAPMVDYAPNDWGDEDRFVPQILPAPAGPLAVITDLAYDGDGTLITLSRDPFTDGPVTLTRGDVSTTLDLPSHARLTSDGSLIVAWTDDQAGLYDLDGSILTSEPLAGPIPWSEGWGWGRTPVRVGRRTAAFLLDDGRIQVLEAR